jgi:hypothetical protein
MVFATREEEIDYFRDALDRAGYYESAKKRWDEATLGRVRKLQQLEEEQPARRRRATVYDDESGSDEEESEDEEEAVDEQGICWSSARGPDVEEEEAEAPTRRRCGGINEGRQCSNPVLGANEKCDFDPTRFCGPVCAAAASARAGALAEKMEAEALERKRSRSNSDLTAKKPARRAAAPGLTDMMAACARAPEPEPEPAAPPSPVAHKKKMKKKPKKKPEAGGRAGRDPHHRRARSPQGVGRRGHDREIKIVDETPEGLLSLR